MDSPHSVLSTLEMGLASLCTSARLQQRQGEQMGLEQVVYGLRGTDCCCALQWSSDASRHACAAQQRVAVLSLKDFIFHPSFGAVVASELAFLRKRQAHVFAYT